MISNYLTELAKHDKTNNSNDNNGETQNEDVWYNISFKDLSNLDFSNMENQAYYLPYYDENGVKGLVLLIPYTDGMLTGQVRLQNADSSYYLYLIDTAQENRKWLYYQTDSSDPVDAVSPTLEHVRHMSSEDIEAQGFVAIPENVVNIILNQTVAQ